MKIIYRIANVLKECIFFLALVVLLLEVIGFATGVKPYVVDSGSMSPKIETGSLAFVNQKKTTLATGDIVAFNRGDMLATHRILKKTGKGYITKGDNNTFTEEISQAQVVGETMFSVPKIGFAVNWATSPKGRIILITLCFSILLLSFIQPVSKEEAEKETRKKKKATVGKTN